MCSSEAPSSNSVSPTSGVWLDANSSREQMTASSTLARLREALDKTHALALLRRAIATPSVTGEEAVFAAIAEGRARFHRRRGRCPRASFARPAERLGPPQGPPRRGHTASWSGTPTRCTSRLEGTLGRHGTGKSIRRARSSTARCGAGARATSRRGSAQRSKRSARSIARASRSSRHFFSLSSATRRAESPEGASAPARALSRT